MFLSFYLDGWSVPRRTLGKYEVLTLPTASGRSDQSHRLAPVSITPYTCHQNQKGRVGRGKENHTLPKGSVNHGQAATGQRMSHWGDMCEELRRYLLYRLGLAGGISTSSDEAHQNRKVKEWVTDCATHIFPSKN